MVLTNKYLTDQLIPYIGNKRKLLGLISQAVHKTGLHEGTFFDVFSGSGVVSRMAKVMGFRVISNDWEQYSQTINRAYIEANYAPDFKKLGGIDKAISELNSLDGHRGYIASHYCPADDENYDISIERMFYTQQNGRRIDGMREKIFDWYSSGNLTDLENDILLACLVFQAAYCSNTSGVFKGFHNGWGGATKTAWYRIRSCLTLKVPIFYDNMQHNIVLRDDATKIAPNVKCDIAYLDPPYNQHQYGANYHLLNTVVLWDKPKLNPFISGNGIKDKAAIRLDWRTQTKSLYCIKQQALDEFTRLINLLDTKYILTSYSTDGQMPTEDLLSALNQRGRLSLVTKKYKRYRVSSQRPSEKGHTIEFVAIVDTSKVGREEDLHKSLIALETAMEITI